MCTWPNPWRWTFRAAAALRRAPGKAEEKKLAFLIDFQTRTDPFYQEAIRRVRKEGDIGRIVSGEASYLASSPWPKMIPDLEVNPQDPERRLRAWGVSRALSGDIITEQNIHCLDVMDWVLDQHPLKAFGTGGLGSRTLGDCWDHFSVIFWFSQDVVVTFYSKQYGGGTGDIACQMYGTEGTIDTHYAGDVNIKGKMSYEGGRDGIAVYHGRCPQYRYLLRPSLFREARLLHRGALGAKQPHHHPRPNRRLQWQRVHVG